MKKISLVLFVSTVSLISAIGYLFASYKSSMHVPTTGAVVQVFVSLVFLSLAILYLKSKKTIYGTLLCYLIFSMAAFLAVISLKSLIDLEFPKFIGFSFFSVLIAWLGYSSIKDLRRKRSATEE